MPDKNNGLKEDVYSSKLHIVNKSHVKFVARFDPY